MKNKKIFTILNFILSILFFVGFVKIGTYVATGFIELYPDASDMAFIANLGIIFLLGAVVFVLTVLLHEAGHLILGLRAGMIFKEFSVLNFSIKNIDGKIKFVVKPVISGVGGYCKMTLAKNKKYSTKLLIGHLLGGILVNLLLAVIFTIVAIVSSSYLLTCVAFIGIVFNLYLGLTNALPLTSAIGMEYDMLKIVQTKEDEQYLIKIYTASSISEELLKGESVDNISLECPKSFQFAGDVVLGLVYTDILMRKGEFKQAKELLFNIKNENPKGLSKQNDMFWTIQFLECEIRSDCDVKCLKKYWTNNVQRYIVAMSSMHPSFICFDYAYELLINNDENAANKKKANFDKNLKSYSITDISYCEIFFELIKSKSNT